jgi:hypothetical protein
MGVRRSRAALAAAAVLCGLYACAARRLDGAAPPRLLTVDIGAGLPRSGQWRQGFALADVDGDGALELVHGPPRKGEPLPVIFRRGGEGQWTRWSDARFPALNYTYGDVAVADFDGDGWMDLAFAMHLAPPLVLRGDGAGGFTRAPGLTAALNGFTSRATSTIAWNGDERPALVFLGEGPTALGRGPRAEGMRIAWERDDGTWQAEALPCRTPPNFGDSVAVGDLDGDERSDIAVSTGRIGRRDLAHLSTLDGPAPDVACLAKHAFVRAVAIVEIDASAPAELLTVQRGANGITWTSSVSIARWRDGSWQCQSLIDEEPAEIRTVASGDVNGDGTADVAVTDDAGRLRVLLGLGRSRFREAALTQPPPSGCAGSGLELADLDGDGRDEVVASFAAEPDPTRCPSGGAIIAWRLVTP